LVAGVVHRPAPREADLLLVRVVDWSADLADHVAIGGVEHRFAHRIGAFAEAPLDDRTADNPLTLAPVSLVDILRACDGHLLADRVVHRLLTGDLVLLVNNFLHGADARSGVLTGAVVA